MKNKSKSKKIKKRNHYKHRFANPKVAYTREYANKYDSVDWNK